MIYKKSKIFNKSKVARIKPKMAKIQRELREVAPEMELLMEPKFSNMHAATTFNITCKNVLPI